ncbi:beta-N-acetylglucosaminidase domain-containing protein [Saccharomonospora cyanea]|uniref:beta-N-acetylglucosaminidase domain-containing protein n=1 Tax=Saccharomonospora cyanea TaxID=40989 RepID=UPI000318ADB8|nr:beta-N-acetylglucosaminidase domain-containing protein [Saccharomonospora cyanea]
MARFGTRLAALSALASVTIVGAAGVTPVAAHEPAVSPSGATPVVSPTPHHLVRSGDDVVVPGRVDVVVDDDTDAAALELLRDVLHDRGVDRVRVRDADRPGRAPLTIRLGSAERPDVASALGDTEVPEAAEGYALRVDDSGHALGTVAIGGVDPAGQYYAVQTFRQLLAPSDDGGVRVAGVSVSDFPAMPLRGTIEGFYGSPWTHTERLDQLAFYGDVKFNTYVYAPKDDPYHRDRWREPYPADKLAELGELVRQAGGPPRTVHVRALPRNVHLLLQRPGPRGTDGEARSPVPARGA